MREAGRSVVDVLARTPAPRERLALVGPDRTRTYGELAAEVDARAAALVGRGMRSGDVATLVVEPDVESILTLLAFWRVGATPVPLNAKLTEPERRAAAKVVGELRGAASDDASARPAVGAQVILWTSGTGGRARGVAISFDALAASTRAVAERLELGADDVWLASLSPAHVGGLVLVARAFLLGCTLVAVGPFDAVRVSALIDGSTNAPAGGARDGSRPLTHVSLVPTQLLRLLEVRSDAPPPASFRCALIGGAKAPERLVARAVAVGWPIALTYGLTEAASQVATAPPALVRVEPGSVGPALDGVEVRIGPDDEILVRGATLASGYVPPEATFCDAAGWHHTGDLGRIDPAGRLWVTGRRIDRIVSGGVTVDAAEVEEALRMHPAVRDAAVVGIPDDEWGERVGAWVGPTAGSHTLEAAALEAWLRARLSPAKLPRVWRFAPGVPRNANGKLDRTAVRDALTRQGR